MGTSCYFIGHREAGKDVFPLLVEAVEKHITEYGVTDFYVGHMLWRTVRNIPSAITPFPFTRIRKTVA